MVKDLSKAMLDRLTARGGALDDVLPEIQLGTRHYSSKIEIYKSFLLDPAEPVQLGILVDNPVDQLNIDQQPIVSFDQLAEFALNSTTYHAHRIDHFQRIKTIEADRRFVFGLPSLGREHIARKNSESLRSGFAAAATYVNLQAATGETLPWGVRSAWNGSDISAFGNFAQDTFAFVIDSGVLATTEDLNISQNSINWSRSWVPGENPFEDGNGHGTHVAGTIGAMANGKGVVGVAPGAQIVSLKVFDSFGRGASANTIINAIDYAVAVVSQNNLDRSKVVVNMSLSGRYNSSIDNAIRRAADQGIRFAVAAGNDGRDVDLFSPSSAGDHPNVYTVSAVDSQLQMASFSNWDRQDRRDTIDDVDYAAAGVGVLSYYKDGQLASLSGTSMAAPHVAGLLIAGDLKAGDYVDQYYTGTSDPLAVGDVAVLTSNPDIPSGPGDQQPPQYEEPNPEPPQSEDLVIWGTLSNDILSGGDSKDRITGVLATGEGAQQMGAGQIDQLFGGLESDTFLLGDNRGVFYDDRNARSTGSRDYALITDFASGTDKLQLFESSYITVRSRAGLYVYWDRNLNGRLDTRSRSFSGNDELIAVLEGVPSIGQNDIVWL